MAQYIRNFGILLVFCAAIALAACQDTARTEQASKEQASKEQPDKEQPDKKQADLPTVGILVYDASDVYIALVQAAMLKELEGRATVQVAYAEGDARRQKNQMETMLRADVDGLIIYLATTQGFPAFLETIRKADVPVVFVNHEPDLALLKRYEKACYVGTNSEESGIMQGEIIKKLWDAHPEYDRNSDNKFQFVMLDGPISSTEALHRTEYSISRARDLGVFMEQVGPDLVCNWLQDEAFKNMKQVLASGIGNIEIIVSNNDTMALGAIEALAEIGYNRKGGPADKFIPVVGVDAVPDAVAAIENGVMSATVEQDAGETARVTVACLLNGMAGKDFLDGLQLKWDSSGVAIRLPFNAHGDINLFPQQ